MTRVVVAMCAVALALTGCLGLSGGGAPRTSVDLADLETEEQAVLEAADEAVPLMLAEFADDTPPFDIAYATSVAMRCNLESGFTAGVVIVLEHGIDDTAGDASAEAVLPDLDTVTDRVLTALRPVGYTPGDGLGTQIATRGDIQVRSSLAAVPGEPSNYTWIIYGDCLEANDDQRRELTREFGSRPIDTSAW